MPHVFKALQLLSTDNYVSRASFCKELHLGEGSVKTLILHLKDAGMVKSTKAGTFLTKKGRHLIKDFLDVISNECDLKKGTITASKFNHAVILRNYGNKIKSGLEQRDYGILYGATGVITLLFKNRRFVFPSDEKDALVNDKAIKKKLDDKLKPKNGDAIIISSADDPFVAEISSKNSALWTLATS
jgi:hypothetical protein